MRLISAYLVGLIFGLGISISGMGNPAKVVNFFDFAGQWDPSLAFVMAGALLVTFLGYRWVLPRPKPLQSDRFYIPASRIIDSRLLGGAIVFGIGWGISGFCPGGAIPVTGTLNQDVLIFMASLLAGVIAVRLVQKRRQTKTARQPV